MVALGQMARNRSTVRCRNVVSCFIALPLLWQWKQWFTCDSTNTDVKWQLSCHLFWLFFFLPQPEASLEARPLGQFCRIKTIVWSESCAWQHISVPSFCGEHLDVTGQNKTRHKWNIQIWFPHRALLHSWLLPQLLCAQLMLDLLPSWARCWQVRAPPPPAAYSWHSISRSFFWTSWRPAAGLYCSSVRIQEPPAAILRNKCVFHC